jgi:galacturan 1,4-alpha-galacturonidase
MSYIEDVVIENVWMLNGQVNPYRPVPHEVCLLKLAPKHGGRIKTWAGPTAGYGYVNNVTFRYALCSYGYYFVSI